MLNGSPVQLSCLKNAAVQCVSRAPSLLIHIAGLRREAVRVVLLALFDVGRRISYLLITVRIAVVLLWYRACPISHPKDDSTRYAEVGATPQCNPSFHSPLSLSTDVRRDMTHEP